MLMVFSLGKLIRIFRSIRWSGKMLRLLEGTKMRYVAALEVAPTILTVIFYYRSLRWYHTWFPT